MLDIGLQCVASLCDATIVAKSAIEKSAARGGLLPVLLRSKFAVLRRCPLVFALVLGSHLLLVHSSIRNRLTTRLICRCNVLWLRKRSCFALSYKGA
jgi:hypothetical protein